MTPALPVQAPPGALEELGWSDWFARQDIGVADTVARVAAVDRDALLLVDGAGHFRAALAGNYRHLHRQPQDQPCVGDWVGLQGRAEDGGAVIHTLLARRSALSRKAAGTGAVQQMIAANLDCVIIVQACEFDFNLHRLERALVAIAQSGAAPLILLTKTDRVDAATLAAQEAQIRAAGIDAPLLMLSNRTMAGWEDFCRRLKPAQTYCFIGSSGVGKSTLINRLLGHEQLTTAAVSISGEGRHTTTRRALLRLPSGALVVDTPGMREFGILAAQTGLDENYAAITALAAHCRYRNCTHTGEPGCAVLAAVQAEDINAQTHAHFLKLKKEADFNDLSAAQRRAKDRRFGHLVSQASTESKRQRRF